MQSLRNLDGLFRRQHGVVSRAQALGQGNSARAIDRKVSSGAWKRVFPGVYRLPSSTNGWMQKVFAAYLWAEDAVVCGLSAARMLGLEVTQAKEVELMSTRPGRRAPSEVRMHFVRKLPAQDVATMGGVRLTTPTRTIIDLSGLLPPDELEAVLEEALRRKLTNLERLLRRLKEVGKGRRGAGELRRMILERLCEGQPTGSKLEVLLMQGLRKAGLPMPVKQYEVYDRDTFIARPDFAYPEELLAIEPQGYEGHAGRRKWKKDIRRRRAMIKRGWRVYEFDWEDIMFDLDRVVDEIRQALGFQILDEAGTD